MNHLMAILDSSPAWTEQNPKPGNCAFAGLTPEGKEWWCFSGISPDVAGVSYQIVWEGGQAGDMISVDDALYQSIRPLGNNTDGSATGVLAATAPAGTGLRNMQIRTSEAQPKVALLYPADDANNPDILTIYRYEFSPEETSGWPGHGWVAEYDWTQKDATARAVWFYLSESTGYQTGAFVLGPSRFNMDEDGNPLMVYQTETPPGRATAEPEAFEIGMLWGSLITGTLMMPVGMAQATRLFWEHNQDGSTTPGPADWTDTGQTVQGMAGTVVLVEDKSIFAVGQDIRIEDLESVITSVWDGGEGIILNPYHAYSIGSAIEYKA